MSNDLPMPGDAEAAVVARELRPIHPLMAQFEAMVRRVGGHLDSLCGCNCGECEADERIIRNELAQFRAALGGLLK